MLSGAIAYQVLQRESPQTIDKVKAVLEKHPWYTNQWQARLQDVPIADHDLVLFNLRRLQNEATVLRSRQEFQWNQLTELASTAFESWAKESFEIATKIGLP